MRRDISFFIEETSVDFKNSQLWLLRVYKRIGLRPLRVPSVCSWLVDMSKPHPQDEICHKLSLILPPRLADIMKDIGVGNKKITNAMIAKTPYLAEQQVSLRMASALWYAFKKLEGRDPQHQFQSLVKHIGDPPPHRFLKCDGSHPIGHVCDRCGYGCCPFCNRVTYVPGWEALCKNPLCTEKIEKEKEAKAAIVAAAKVHKDALAAAQAA